ncbi:MAG: hypothetical protein ACUVV0_01965 [Anaerolineae bacterium]
MGLGEIFLAGLALAGLIVVAFRVREAVRIYSDARKRRFHHPEALFWALVGLFAPDRYWWGRRLEVLEGGEAQLVLAAAAHDMGLKDVSNLLCPLCERQELEGVLRLSPSGSLSVRGKEVICSRCGFRLDCCRHCRHFTPGSSSSQLSFGSADRTQGRCEIHREWRPVNEICPPSMSRRLMEMGYEALHVRAVIRDSYVPLEECRAFALDEKGLRLSGAKHIDRKRLNLLRLAEKVKA